MFQITTDGVLLKPLNVSNLVVQNAQILILAIGMVMVIVARHIDLSVGSVAAFVGAVGAIMMTKYDVPWLLAVILCLALGALIGAWHGFWVAYVGIPAFIVTLASMLLFRGLTWSCSRAATVGGLPDGFKKIGNGFLPEIGPDTGLHNLTMVLGVSLVARAGRAGLPQAARPRSATTSTSCPLPLFLRQAGRASAAVIIEFAYLLADARGLPIVGLILFALIGVYTLHHAADVFGRHVYAIGGNVDAATMSGRQHQARRLPGDDQHGPAGRARRPGHHRPARRPPTPRPASTSSSTRSPRRSSVARP